jgi:hypothetical protein
MKSIKTLTIKVLEDLLCLVYEEIYQLERSGLVYGDSP